MMGQFGRSTRGRVAIITASTFLLIGSFIYLMLDRTSVINSLQDVHDESLLEAEHGRIIDELRTTGSVEPRSGQVRTLVVPADRVFGLDPSSSESYTGVLPDGTDLSPEGLDPALFDTYVVVYPVLNLRGWHAFDSFDDEFEAAPTGDVVILSAVIDHSIVGPLSLHGLLITAIPVGSLIAAALFAAVAGTGLRPVRRMSSQAADIQLGDLDHRLPDPGTGDELSDLATTINAMLDRIDEGVGNQRRFVADAAHELRSPVTASTALLEVALAADDDDDWRSTAARVLDEQRRLGGLVDDLVLLARLDDSDSASEAAGQISLDDIVVSETSRPFAHRLDVVELEPVEFVGDANQLVRLVRNLLSNADRHASSQIEVRLRSDAETVVLQVDDDGPGVPVEQRKRVFDRFTRLDQARARDSGGSGIGLAIVKHVAERYGGTATVTGSPLGGACFIITLALTSEANQSTPPT